MPRTEKRAVVRAKPHTVNGPMARDVLTLSEVAIYLRLPEPEVLRMVREQGLPVRQIGSEWRFLKTAVQHWLATGSPLNRGNKDALLAAAGSFRDDPDLLGIVEEAYRQRGRPITEDGSYHLLHGLEPSGSEGSPRDHSRYTDRSASRPL